MVEDYDVIESTAMDEFVKLVREKLKEGWTLYGAPIIYRGTAYTHYSQAIVKMKQPQHTTSTKG